MQSGFQLCNSCETGSTIQCPDYPRGENSVGIAPLYLSCLYSYVYIIASVSSRFIFIGWEWGVSEATVERNVTS